MDEREHGGDGGRLARHERLAATEEDQEGGDYHEDDDADGEGGGGVEGARGFGFQEERGDGYGEEIAEDSAEGDEGHEPVVVEEGFDQDHAVRGALVV